MKQIRRIFFFFILTLFFFQIKAQDQVLHGVVQCYETIPLVGAQIQVKSTGQIIKTDTLGRFIAPIHSKDKLTVSAHGFYQKKIKLKEGVKLLAINMKLKPGEKGRAYAIGYGHVLDEEKLNSVAQLTQEDVDFSQYSNMYNLITGRFNGVTISGGNVIIRGESSLLGSNAALIIVDGMEVGSGALANLAPMDIKSIDVLKDGSAAIYGSRAAGGVVIIQTKTGKD